MSKRQKTGKKGTASVDADAHVQSAEPLDSLDAGGLTPPSARPVDTGESGGLTPPPPGLVNRDPFEGMNDIFDDSSLSPPLAPLEEAPAAGPGPSKAARRGSRRRSGVEGRAAMGQDGEKEGEVKVEGQGGTKGLKIKLKVGAGGSGSGAVVLGEPLSATPTQSEGEGTAQKRQKSEPGSKGSVKGRKKARGYVGQVGVKEKADANAKGDDLVASKRSRTGRGGIDTDVEQEGPTDKTPEAADEADEADETVGGQTVDAKSKPALARKKSSVKASQPAKKRRTARSESETTTDDLFSESESESETPVRDSSRAKAGGNAGLGAKSRSGRPKQGDVSVDSGKQDNNDKMSTDHVSHPKVASATPVGAMAKQGNADSAKKPLVKKRSDGTASATSTPSRPLPGPSTGKSLTSTPDPTTGIMLPKKKKPVPPRAPAESLLANTLRMLADDAAKKSATPVSTPWITDLPRYCLPPRGQMTVAHDRMERRMRGGGRSIRTNGS